MLFFGIWIVGLIICLALDDWYYEKKIKGKTYTGWIDTFFHFSSAYIALTILFLIWLFNKK